ncbi:hypothetical protein Tco_0767906 [Tanacetum coccineum]
MAETNDDIPPPPPPQTQTPTHQTPYTILTIKLPILKKGEYDIWAMKIEHYLPIQTILSGKSLIKEGNGPRKRRKARATLNMALPTEDHLATFHIMTDAIRERLTEDANQKFLGSRILLYWSSSFLNQETSQDSLSFDDLYNNLRVFESDVKGSTASSFSTQNMAFVFENTSSTNDVSTAYGVSTSTGHISQCENNPSSYSFLTNQSSCPQLDHDDLEQLDEFDLEEMDLKWQVAMISMRMNKFYKKTCRKLQFDAKEPVDPRGIKIVGGEMLRTLGIKIKKIGGDLVNKKNLKLCNSGSDTEVTSFSKECKESYAKLKKLYDEQREQLGDASIEIQAYTQALKKVEAQLVGHQQNQLWYEEKIRFMKIDLDDKTDVLTYHKKLLAEAEKEKEELKAKVEKWHNSSKSLNILLNSQMSARDKDGLGYGDQMNKGVLSYENEVFGSLFNSRSSDIEDSHVNDRYAKGMHAQSKPSESDARSSDFNSCKSNSSEETLESMPEPVVNEPKVVSQPKVWYDAPIIEEYESDSDDEHVSLPTKEQETPSFAFVNTIKHVKTPRQTVKEQNICSQSPKPNKKDCSGLMSKKLGLGYGFTKKACFGTSQMENRPVWNNVQRVNYQNQFVPTAILTRICRIPVNTARASSTNNVNTARHNFNSQAVPTNAARKVHTVKPIVNNVRPKTIFHKTYSPIRRPFNRTTAPRTNFSNQKVNTAEVKAVSAVRGKRETAVKPSAGCNWRPKRHYWNKVSKYNGGSNSRKCDYPQRALKNKGIVDSGCSRHMTGNKAYLAEYQDYNGGPVAFGGSKGYITGKGKIKTGKLDFEDVCFVKELQHFNLFSVSQMCDKKNKVLFTDTECLVLSPDFKRFTL